MLDIALGYELALIVCITAGIAWLMGRAFCKSKDYQVQADLNALQMKHDDITTLVSQKDSILQEKIEQLRLLDKEYTDLTYTHEADAIMLQRLQKERKETLGKLQDLEEYRVKFERLSENYDTHSKKLVDLKTQYGNAQDNLQSKNDQITQQKQQLQNETDNVLSLEQILADKKEALTTQITDKEAIITTLVADKKTLESELQQQRAAKEATIQQAENDKHLWQTANTDQQQNNAQLKQQLLVAKNEITTLQQQSQKKTHYNDKVIHKKSVLQMHHKQQLLKMSALKERLDQQLTTLTNKDALIKRLQQENKALSLLNQQNSVKIDELNEKLTVYWQAADATNSRISGMLKNLPASN